MFDGLGGQNDVALVVLLIFEGIDVGFEIAAVAAFGALGFEFAGLVPTAQRFSRDSKFASGIGDSEVFGSGHAAVSFLL